MKTKGRVLAVAVVIIGLTVGTTGSSLAFGGWPYPGHTMRPDLEDQKGVSAEAVSAQATAPKKGEGAVKEESGPQASTEKAAAVKVAPEAPRGN